MSRIPDGTKVKVTVSGMVRDRVPNDRNQGAQRVIDDQGRSHWVSFSEEADIEVVAEAHAEVRPGQVWRTEDCLYFARISRPGIPLRLTPADMTEERGLATLDVHAFFHCYPDAIMAYDPDAFDPAKYVRPSHTRDDLGCQQARHRNGRGSHTA